MNSSTLSDSGWKMSFDQKWVIKSGSTLIYQGVYYNIFAYWYWLFAHQLHNKKMRLEFTMERPQESKVLTKLNCATLSEGKKNVAWISTTNGTTPEWMLYHGKSYIMDELGVPPFYRYGPTNSYKWNYKFYKYRVIYHYKPIYSC